MFGLLPFARSLSVASLAALVACGGGSTPLAIPSGGGGVGEVPRDQDDTSPAKPTASGAHPPILVADSPSSDGTSPYTAPTPIKTAQTSSAPVARPKGKGAGNGKVSQKECADMIDRYLDLSIAGPGGPLAEMSGKELEQGKVQLKALAAGDKSFASLQTTCEKTATRSQFDCAMSAPTSSEWQSCVK